MSNILDKIQLSGTTYDITDSTAIHSLDGYWTSGQTNNAITAATNALAESIAEQGYQTSGDVQNAISGKVDTDTYTAYTASTATEIGNKADTTAMTQAISEATSGKADTTAVTQAISEAVSGKVDTSTYTAYTAATDTALAGKQATLVSGTNIKTVGGNSLLGSGNIAFPASMTAEVSGTTLIFS